MASTHLVLAHGRPQPRQQLSAWETAKSRFLDGLDPTERKLFNEATPENLLYTSSHAERVDSKDSKFRLALQKIQPLVNSVEQYGKAIDVYAQIQPLCLSPVWGSLRVVLIMASAHDKFYSRMVDTFGKIGQLLPQLHDYGRLFGEHQRFANALSDIYLDIIEICIGFKTTLKEQKASRMRRVFKPLSTSTNLQFDEAVARFHRHHVNVEKEALICHMIEDKESSELVLRNKLEEERRLQVQKQEDLISKLSTLDRMHRHRQLQRLRYAGTGAWALDKFSAWVATPSSSVFCCTGIPGAGKSVLTSIMIDHILAAPTESSKPSPLIFFYCDWTITASLLFLNLAQQLLYEFDPRPSSILIALERIARNPQICDFEDAVDFFNEIVILFYSHTIVIDGLDELSAADQKIVVKTLLELKSSPECPVSKIYISSREDATQWLKISSDASFSIRLSQEYVGPDIEIYTRHAVNQLIKDGDLQIADASLENEIVTSLVGGSQGMFLWVKLQLSELCFSKSDRAILEALENLPRTLGETFDRFLVRAGNDSQHLILYDRMFNWMLCAKRILLVDELREAMAFSENDRHYDGAKLPNDLALLARLCGNLVIIDEETQQVQFAHYSIRQYLLEERDVSKSAFVKSAITRNNEVGALCVSYLLFSDFERQLTNFDDGGANENMAVMAKAIVNTPALSAGSVGSSVAKFLLYIRRQERIATQDIKFSHTIQLAKSKVEPNWASKYTLLPYISENWLHHTASFHTGWSNELIWEQRQRQFSRLVSNTPLPFKIGPWDDPETKLDDHPVWVYIGIALELNHTTLARAIVKSDRAEPSKFWKAIGQWISANWSNVSTPSLRSASGYDRKFSSLVPDPNEWQGWVYYRVLACTARGEGRCLFLLLEHNHDDNAITTPESLFTIYGQLLIESSLMNRASIAIAIINKITDWDSEKRRNVWQLCTNYKGLTCNGVQLAALKGLDFDYDEDLAHEARIASSAQFLDSLLLGEKMSKAVINRDSIQLLRLFKALGVMRMFLDSKGFIDLVFSGINNDSFQTDLEFSNICGKLRFGHVWQNPARYDHWVNNIPCSNLVTRLDLLLAAGVKPSTKDAEWLIQWTISNSQDQISSHPDVCLKRIQRLIHGSNLIGMIPCAINGTEPEIKELRTIYNLHLTELSAKVYAMIYKEYKIAKFLIAKHTLEDPKLPSLHYAIHAKSLDMIKFIYKHTQLDDFIALTEPERLERYYNARRFKSMPEGKEIMKWIEQERKRVANHLGRLSDESLGESSVIPF